MVQIDDSIYWRMRVNLLYIHLLLKMKELLKSLGVELGFIPTTFFLKKKRRGSSYIWLAMQATQQDLPRSTVRDLVPLKCHRGSKTTNQFSNLINLINLDGHSHSSRAVNPTKRSSEKKGGMWPAHSFTCAPSTWQVRVVSRSTRSSTLLVKAMLLRHKPRNPNPQLRSSIISARSCFVQWEPSLQISRSRNGDYSDGKEARKKSPASSKVPNPTTSDGVDEAEKQCNNF